MKFKPTKLKTIISIAAIIIWYSLNSALSGGIGCACICMQNPNCKDVFVFEIFPKDDCNCGVCPCPEATNLYGVIEELTYLLFPGILVYFIWSLIQKKKNIKSSKIKSNNKRKK